MQVILLEKVHRLGNLGDTVQVKRGYGRNFLIPQSKALPATEKNHLYFEGLRTELEKTAKEALDLAHVRAASLADVVAKIASKVGDGGKLFGSVGAKDIAQALFDSTGIQIDKHEIILVNGPIRLLGDYEVKVQLHTDVSVPLKVSVIAG